MKRLSQPIKIILFLCVLTGFSTVSLYGLRWVYDHIGVRFQIITNVTSR